MTLFGRKHKHDADSSHSRDEQATGNSLADSFNGNNTQNAAQNPSAAAGGSIGTGSGTTAARRASDVGMNPSAARSAGAGTAPIEVGAGQRQGTHGEAGAYGQQSYDKQNAHGGVFPGAYPNSQPHNAGASYQSGTSASVPVGSAALREHGLRLEREAEMLHSQSAEIAEAERLEQEAREHRERAVAAGADPMYRQPFTSPGGMNGTNGLD